MSFLVQIRDAMGRLATRLIPESHNLRRLFADQGVKHWKGYVVAFVLSLGVSAMTTMSAWIMKDVVNQVYVARSVSAVWFLGGAIIVIFTVKGFSAYGQAITLSQIANSIVADIQRRIFDKMLSMSLASYSSRHSTEFIARQAFISQSASNSLNLIINGIAKDGFTIVGLLGVMVLQDPFMSALALIVTPLALLGTYQLGGRAKIVLATEFQGFQIILQSLQETAQGIRVIKAFALEPFMRRRQSDAIASFQRAANKLSKVGARASPMTETLAGVAVAIIVVYSGLSTIHSGREPGAFFAFVTSLLLAFEPAKRLSRMHIDLTGNLLGVEILYSFLDEPSEEDASEQRPSLLVREGRVEYRKVEFEYREGESVLRGLDLTLEPGRTTALVGRSGGGKTTAMNMLLRFYEPSSGVIYVDGQDIRRFSRASLRRQIAYVGQDTFLFNGTIAENIAMGRPGPATTKSSPPPKRRMRTNSLWVLTAVTTALAASKGRNYRAGSGSGSPSREPFCAMRRSSCSMRRPPRLNSESERAIQDALRTLCAGRTTLVIAHRLSTVAHADRICVIERVAS